MGCAPNTSKKQQNHESEGKQNKDDFFKVILNSKEIRQ